MGQIINPPSLASLGGVPTSRVLTAGTNMTGGGDLSTDRTFNATGGSSGNSLMPAINRSGKFLPNDVQQFDTGTNAVGADTITFRPFSKAVTIDALVCAVTIAGAGNARLAIYSSDPVTKEPFELIEAVAEQSINSTGEKIFALAADYDVTEMIWLAFVSSISATFRAGAASQLGFHRLGSDTVGNSTADFRISAAFPYAAFPADTSALTLIYGPTGGPMLCVRCA